MVGRFRNVMDSVVKKDVDLNDDDQYGYFVVYMVFAYPRQGFCKFWDV